MKMTRQAIELSRLRKAGEIIDDAILFFKQNLNPLFRAYFAICGIFWITGIILSVVSQTKTFQLQESGESIYSFTYCLNLIFGFVNFTFSLLTTLSFIKRYADKGNVAPTVNEVWEYFKYYFFRAFSSLILLAILCAAGTICCLLPGIYLFPVSLLVITVMILENGSLSHSFKHAFYLIKGNWWQMLGVLLVMGILISALVILLIIPVAIVVAIIFFLTNVNQTRTEIMTATVTIHVLQFLYVLPVIAIALAYFNLNEQQGDHLLMGRIEKIGIKDEQTDNFPLEDY